jgi:hypothetical protein
MAAAGPEKITRATAEASAIFARTGVELAWADCTGPAPEPLCGQVEGPVALNLRLMPARLAPAELPEGIFGFALMSTTSGFARTANVYYDRVGAIADGRKYRLAVVLGAMMAHEIGHLLLGQGSHSMYGLMSLPWGPKVLTAANRGMLSFSKREAMAIEQAAVERTAVGVAPQRLTLRIYNYAKVDDHILFRAKSITERLFQYGAVETMWLDCPISPDEIQSNPTCGAKPPADHLVLNLLPRSMSRKYELKRGVFGFALSSKDGTPGAYVSLFYERVLDLAYHGGVGTSFDHGQTIILGHMMAHEVGHMLLGPNSHGEKGVMSFPWNPGTLRLAERGLLEFTMAERKRIRAELEQRTQLNQIADRPRDSSHRFPPVTPRRSAQPESRGSRTISAEPEWAARTLSALEASQSPKAGMGPSARQLR